MNNISSILIQIGTGFIGSLLASLVIYLNTQFDLKKIRDAIKEDIRENLINLTKEVKNMTEVLNKLEELQKAKR
ncbi:MAG: hypothetical protein ABIK84_05300 [candidate division WOR-3 bacterium]